MSLYDHIVACNSHDLTKFKPFIIAGRPVGQVRHDLVEVLRAWPRVFDMTGDGVVMLDSIGGADERSAAIADVCQALATRELLPGARNELFPVVTAFGCEPLLRLDRAWVPAFGATAFGVHVNGYVDTPSGPDLWLGVRSPASFVDPGKLDNMVAGGLPADLTPEENVVKEAQEEASVPAELARQARPVGVINYTKEVPLGLRHDMLFLYDLHLPADFRPVNQDGEQTGFEKMPAAQALQIVEEGDGFKFNVSLVIIDFAIRHGILTPEHPDYLKLQRGLRAWG